MNVDGITQYMENKFSIHTKSRIGSVLEQIVIVPQINFICLEYRVFGHSNSRTKISLFISWAKLKEKKKENWTLGERSIKILSVCQFFQEKISKLTHIIHRKIFDLSILCGDCAI